MLGDTIGANLFLVGVAAQRGLLPISIEAIERAVALNGVAVAFNLKAFRFGRLYAADSQRVLSMVDAIRPKPPQLPRTLDEQLAHRSAHLTAYQSPALAARYRALVHRVTVREGSVVTSARLAEAVARNYAKLLAYKDEYEVARLLTQPALQEEIARVFSGGRVSLNLAPPIVAGRLVNGRPRKRRFGAWIRPVLRVLAQGRRLRGTAFDIFGYTADRRLERALVGEYERLVDRVLAALTTENHDLGVKLVALADDIRGFGPVKEAAVKRYRERVVEVEQEFVSVKAQLAVAEMGG